jgi:hypothetical protein
VTVHRPVQTLPLLSRVILGLVLLLVTAFPNSASGVPFGWACITTADCEGAPVSFTLEIEALGDFNFASGGHWPERLWEITSVSFANRTDLGSVSTISGNPFSGWDGIRGAGSSYDFSTPWLPHHLLFSRTLTVATLSLDFGDFRIWSDPSYYPGSGPIHDIWSIAYLNDLSHVWSGAFLPCGPGGHAECFDPGLHVPEPSTFLLVGLGTAVAAGLRRQQKRPPQSTLIQ